MSSSEYRNMFFFLPTHSSISSFSDRVKYNIKNKQLKFLLSVFHLIMIIFVISDIMSYSKNYVFLSADRGDGGRAGGGAESLPNRNVLF